MAHLLGSKNCLESLSKDIKDIDEIIQGFLPKAGRIACTSWKFPNKNAIELDIDELLEDYSYCKDSEANTLSHIIMFELVIDRFCLLLQVASQLFELVSDKTNDERPKSQTVTSTISIGLLTKKFSSKLSMFQYNYCNLEKEALKLNQSLMDLEEVYSNLKLENDNQVQKSVIYKNRKPEEQGISECTSKETHPSVRTTVSTQTFETAFIECDICSKLQITLIDIGENVLKICETQKIASSINKHNNILKSCKFSSSIVNKWSLEFCKEMKKVLHLVQENEGEKNTATRQLHEYKLIIDKDKDAISKLKDENENLRNSNHELNSKFKSLKELMKSCEEKQDILENNKKDLQSANEYLKKELEETIEELGRHKLSIRALEQGMNSLNTQLEISQREYEKNQSSEDQLQNVQEKLRKTEEILSSSNQELEKLRSENKVLLKHDQGLQTKQESLLSRLDQLDEKCDDLQSELSDCATERDQLAEENDQLRSKLDKLNVSLENKLSNGETNGNVSELREEIEKLSSKLELIVKYPVLGRDYRAVEDEYMEIISSGDKNTDEGEVVEDMKRQLQANKTRISILEQQNTSLSNSLFKLNVLEMGSGIKMKTDSEEEKIEKESRQVKSAKNPSTKPLIDVAEREPRPPSAPRENGLQRPRSGGRRIESIQNRLAELERLRKENLQGIIKFDESTSPKSNYFKSSMVMSKTTLDNSQTTVNIPSVDQMSENLESTKERPGNTINSTKKINESTPFACPDCGRRHISERDLEIHRPFCFHRL